MKYNIQIPKPCHESWDKMTPNEQGRYCAQCCKTVIDFTNWQQEDILVYLQQQDEGNVCGRLRREQLNVPVTIEQFVGSVAYSPLPLYKKIAAILLLAFGLIQIGYDADAQTTQVAQPLTGFAVTPVIDPQITGGMVVRRPVPDTVKPAKHIPVSEPNHHLMGKPVPKKVKTTVQPNKSYHEPFVNGDIWYAPADTGAKRKR